MRLCIDFMRGKEGGIELMARRAKESRERRPHVAMFRQVLQELVRGKLEGVGREAVYLGTSIQKSALDAMVYRGEGGLDAWVELCLFLFGIEQEGLPRFVEQFRQFFLSNVQMSHGEKLWTQTGVRLSEDKRHFWSGIVNFVEEVRPPFQIKQMEAKGSPMRTGGTGDDRLSHVPSDIIESLEGGDHDWEFLRSAMGLPREGKKSLKKGLNKRRVTRR